jgi:glutamyl-tRNA reductase
MTLSIIGLNHNSAPVDIREKIAFSPEQLSLAYQALNKIDQVEESVIVSTCNRTEIYCYHNDNVDQQIVQWLNQFHNIKHNILAPHLYYHQDSYATEHLFRVCSGLDSLVLGEPQILGQIKSAFSDANQSKSIKKHLSKLFHHAFSVAKQVRTDTEIGANPVSVAFAAVTLSKQIFGELSKQTALMIGAGETIELAVRHLKKNNIGSLIIANRTIKKAQKICDIVGGKAIGIDQIPNYLHQADIIISSTASQLPILGKGAVESALKKRKYKPMFMVDIAVPRDIEQEVEDIDDVFLYTVDDLKEVIEENQRSRQQAALQAEKIITEHVKEFDKWLKSLDAVETITQLRSHMNTLAEELLQLSLKQIDKGKTTEEVLRHFSNNLTNKVLHNPTIQLRQAARDDCLDVIDATKILFDLNNREKE